MNLSLYVILQNMLEAIELTTLLAEYIGLLIIADIDQFVGLILESYLENRYEDEIINKDEIVDSKKIKFMEFSVTQQDKNACYVFVMTFNVLLWLNALSCLVLYKFDYCPNYDKQMKFAEENPDYGWTELATGGWKILFVFW